MPKAVGDGRVAAFEIMKSITAIRNLIREGKSHQLQTVIQTNSRLGMVTMDASLIDLYNAREITKETLLRYSVDKKAVKRRIGDYV
jgi:twitching motility protein PilT